MQPKQFTLKVDAETTAIDFLTKKLSGQSRSSIKQLFAHRCVWLGQERPLMATQMVRPGDVVAVRSQREQHKELRHPLLRIVWEDEYLIAVEKREGLLSVATDREREKTAYNILNEHARQFGQKGHVYVVHRLDRETSGIMIFAKTQEAQEKLRADWNETILERQYVAVVEGRMPQCEGKVESWLVEDKQTYVHSSPVPVEGGQWSLTHYQVLQTNARYSLLRLDLETGRTNQIRVHMQSLGHPVVGDSKYGPDPSPRCRMMLHAKTIRFHHPITGQELSFEMRVPREFAALMR